MQVYMGGIVPTSLASLKKNTCLTISLAGCNFKCPYCNTPEFLDFKAEYLIDILEAKRQINALYGSVDTVLFSGGEPTLQRQALLNLARHCKNIGLKVGVATNGAQPQSIISLLREDLIDFIKVDLKSTFEEDKFEEVTKSKNFFKSTESIMEEIKETISVLKKSEDKIQIFFKTTITPGLLEKKEDLSKIAKSIEHVKATWILQGFNPEKAFDKTFRTKKIVMSEELEFLREEMQKIYPHMTIEVG